MRKGACLALCLALACGLAAGYVAVAPRLRARRAARPPPLTVAEYTTLGPAPLSGAARGGGGGGSWRLVRDRASPKRTTPIPAGCVETMLALPDAERAAGADAVQRCGELCAAHAADGCAFFYVNRRTGTDRTIVRRANPLCSRERRLIGAAFTPRMLSRR